MIYGRNQRWRTTFLPYSLALTNTVNTGGSYMTSSGTIPNQKIWASAGFRGFGPTMTFPGGSGMDGMGCGCGCKGTCGCQDSGGGLGSMLCLGIVAAAAFWFFGGRGEL
jgi:hypothetical protein